MVKNLPANAGDANSIPGAGRSPEEGNGNPLQSSCPENSMDRVSLAGYSPWGHKESDTTECTHIHTFTSSSVLCSEAEISPRWTKLWPPPLVGLATNNRARVQSGSSPQSGLNTEPPEGSGALGGVGCWRTEGVLWTHHC